MKLICVITSHQRVQVPPGPVGKVPVWFTGSGWSVERPDALEFPSWHKAGARLDRETVAHSVNDYPWVHAQVVEEREGGRLKWAP